MLFNYKQIFQGSLAKLMSIYFIYLDYIIFFVDMMSKVISQLLFLFFKDIQ